MNSRALCKHLILTYNIASQIYGVVAYSTPEGVVHAPPKKVIERLLNDIKQWEAIINEEAENFTGDILIGHQEDIKSLASLVESWTEVSVQIFTRHQHADDAEKSLENKRMRNILLGHKF